MPLENSPPFPRNVSNGKPLNNQDIPQNYRGTWSLFFSLAPARTPVHPMFGLRQQNYGCVEVYFPLFSLTPFSILNSSSSPLESFLARHNPLSASTSKMEEEQRAQPNTCVLQANYNGGPVLLHSFSNFHILITSKWGYKWRNFCQISQKCHGWNILVDRGFLLISKLSQTIVCGWYWAHWLLPTN